MTNIWRPPGRLTKSRNCFGKQDAFALAQRPASFHQRLCQSRFDLEEIDAAAVFFGVGDPADDFADVDGALFVEIALAVETAGGVGARERAQDASRKMRVGTPRIVFGASSGRRCGVQKKEVEFQERQIFSAPRNFFNSR